MTNPPFQSFTFTLVEDRCPRASFRMAAVGDGMFELTVQKGPASNPSSQFTRAVPLEAAERLRDALQRAGAFGWDERYGDATAPGSRRWTMSAVLQEGVFSIESRGGSDVPPGFDELLEELYRLDFPRPAGARPASANAVSPRGLGSLMNAAGAGGAGSVGGMSAADLSALASSGKLGDLGALGDFGALGGLEGLGDLADLADPQALQQRMKDEFRHMSPAEQSDLLDLLAATGMATREWWERFLRGGA